VGRYRRILGRLFEDVWQRGQPVSWVDVGAGYGEVVEAVAALAPAGSSVEGREPMQPKAAAARARGLPVVHGYLTADHDKVDFVSVVDVFSHIPDFSSFLELIRAVLKPGGEVFIETGNLADLGERNEFPGELGLPDHLVFAGEAQLRGYLERAGFEVVKLEGEAVDDWLNLVKNVVKKLLGRPVKLAWPFTSRYRQLLVRARLRPVG
jgi:SAM-dependent methyltransferase